MAQAGRDLGVHENVLRKWVKEFGSDPVQAFPGHGQMKPEQLEIERLRREVTKLKAERDILKKAAAYFAKLPERANRSNLEHRSCYFFSRCPVRANPVYVLSAIALVFAGSSVAAAAEADLKYRWWYLRITSSDHTCFVTQGTGEGEEITRHANREDACKQAKRQHNPNGTDFTDCHRYRQGTIDDCAKEGVSLPAG